MITSGRVGTVLNAAAVLGLASALALPLASPPPAPAASPSAALQWAYPRPPVAETIVGTVAHLSDGDSFFLRTIGGDCGTSPRRASRDPQSGCRAIRLQGVDAPELGQTCERDGHSEACGEKAREALERLIGGQSLTCEMPADDPTDRYGRAIAFCQTAGGTDLGLTMLKEGRAVAMSRYLRSRPHAETYLSAEREAFEAKRGIWATRFVSPTDWRRERRSGG